MTSERTSHDVVVIAWAMMALERFRAAHGRVPVMGPAGVSTWDAREVRRLMDPEPCWDCGESREESQLSDYFCRACRDARVAESLAEIDRDRAASGWVDRPAERAAELAREAAESSREIAARVAAAQARKRQGGPA